MCCVINWIGDLHKLEEHKTQGTASVAEKMRDDTTAVTAKSKG